ncbi:MAG: heparan-alpha-glucosaminide N-acetyltransferase, partial [Desulfonatronovibrio sp.]
MNTKQERLQILDIARGSAVILMVGFHFCYDLNYFHLIDINIKEDPFWIGLRGFIVSLFIFIAGISFYLSSARQFGFKAYLKNQKWLALCVIAISLFTYPLFPESWIYFGVLHFILTVRILAYPFKDFYRLNLILGLIIIWAGLSLQNEIFNSKWINWIGFAAQKPYTEDYVPVFPWLGVFLTGMFTSRFLLNSSKQFKIKSINYSGFPSRIISFAGRNSLAIYMIHQPLL